VLINKIVSVISLSRVDRLTSNPNQNDSSAFGTFYTAEMGIFPYIVVFPIFGKAGILQPPGQRAGGDNVSLPFVLLSLSVCHVTTVQYLVITRPNCCLLCAWCSARNYRGTQLL